MIASPGKVYRLGASDVAGCQDGQYDLDRGRDELGQLGAWRGGPAPICGADRAKQCAGPDIPEPGFSSGGRCALVDHGRRTQSCRQRRLHSTRQRRESIATPFRRWRQLASFHRFPRAIQYPRVRRQQELRPAMVQREFVWIGVQEIRQWHPQLLLRIIRFCCRNIDKPSGANSGDGSNRRHGSRRQPQTRKA